MEEVKKQNLKLQIIEAAREVLLSEGYRNLSLRKIARKIGVSATSIYLHFEGKDNLVHSLIEAAIERLNESLKLALPEKGGPINKLEKLAWAYVNFALTHPREYQIIYLVSSDEMTRYPKEKFRKARKGYKLVLQVLQEGIAEGIVDEKKPRIASYTFWAQLHGVLSVVLSKRLDTRIDQEEFIEEAIDHIISSYRQKTSLEAEELDRI
ncbi:TetR/AcrR family transcriptional regulator [Fodinibius salsisoli]|uniref:TetR/AcrR family transcriptional regulator n=1 Tax=Fodinibius salsisoli TaxID=2820877 RepID=A0ABT3PJM6_9BACT|nr:TetR/AcrR family transcriptional regulator [Fodinibius salsisoli]MCW9705973.1 TetR/AcrR family transcriptional regulator [Fodinibius salsisoli]